MLKMKKQLQKALALSYWREGFAENSNLTKSRHLGRLHAQL